MLGQDKKISKNDLFIFFAISLLSLHYLYLVLDSFQMDFRAFYVASKAVISGLNPYMNNIAVSPEFWHNDMTSRLSGFIYPPTSLIFFLPLSLVKYGVSKFLFSFLMGVCLIAIIFIFRRGVKNEFLLLAFMSFPVMTSFERGQIDLLIVLLVVLFYLNKDNFLGAFFLSVAISIKLLPVLILFYYLCRKEYKIIFRVMLCVFAVFCVSLIFVDIGLYRFYAESFLFSRDTGQLSIVGENLIQNNRVMNYTFNHNYVHGSMSIFNAIFRKIFGVGLLGGRIIPLFIVACSAFVIRKREDNEMLFYWFALLTLIVNDYLWIMGMVWYLPVFFLILREKSENLILQAVMLLPLYLPNFVHFRGQFLNYLFAIVATTLFIIFRNAKSPIISKP